MIAIAGTCFLRHAQPILHRLGQHRALPGGIAGLPPESLVLEVIGTQRIAVQQQSRLAVEIRHHFLRQQTEPGLLRVGRAQQEVAIAVDEVTGHPRGVDLRQLNGDVLGLGRHCIVAYPVFEQVAEDVERLSLPGRAREEVRQPLRDIGPAFMQVQIGNEKRRHAGGGRSVACQSPPTAMFSMMTGSTGTSE
jgi:hypothetical protein